MCKDCILIRIIDFSRNLSVSITLILLKLSIARKIAFCTGNGHIFINICLDFFFQLDSENKVHKKVD